jgi:hypothetical protein
VSAQSRRGRLIAAALGALLAVGATAAGIALNQLPAGERPELLLLTGLPIVFPEQLTLSAPKSPTLTALEERYRVVPISVADRQALSGHKLLLMAQPQAQPAEALVELDEWVRGGGRVLLLADPVLEWPSERPLGDALRPPTAFADTGLVGHWGVRLDAPDMTGRETFSVDGRTVQTVSPGALIATNSHCRVSIGVIANCRIGKGRATIVADADFLAAGNPDFLMAQLEQLEQ